MLTAEAFEQIRRDICASGPPSGGDDLLGMVTDFRWYLEESTDTDDAPDLWHDVSVSWTKGGAWLIRVAAHGARDDAQKIAADLSRIWMKYLRYPYREGHTVLHTSNDVRLLAVTQAGPGALWVTAEVQVLLAS